MLRHRVADEPLTTTVRRAIAPIDLSHPWAFVANSGPHAGARPQLHVRSRARAAAAHRCDARQWSSRHRRTPAHSLKRPVLGTQQAGRIRCQNGGEAVDRPVTASSISARVSADGRARPLKHRGWPARPRRRLTRRRAVGSESTARGRRDGLAQWPRSARPPRPPRGPTRTGIRSACSPSRTAARPGRWTIT